jgi:hypothetical protein
VNVPRFPLSFAGGQVALGVRAGPGTDLARALRAMGLTTGVPTIVLVGTGARPSDVGRLGPLLTKVVVPVAEAVEATVVDEGTSAGLPGLMGGVRLARKAAFPLVGVAGDDSRAGGGQAGGGQADGGQGGGWAGGGWAGGGLDAEHTHFVLVPPHRESELARWVALVADAAAGGNRSVALVAAGGEGAWGAVREHVAAGRLVMAVSRSGGVADHLSAALAGRPADRRAAALASSGRICAVDPGRGAAHVADMLRSALSRPDALGPGPTGPG